MNWDIFWQVLAFGAVAGVFVAGLWGIFWLIDEASSIYSGAAEFICWALLWCWIVGSIALLVAWIFA